jgi:hypothetical protein
MAVRIQRKRVKGWRMPENCIYVGRGTIWGNPFAPGAPCGLFDGKDGRSLGIRDQVEILVPSLSLEQCIEFYSDLISGCVSPEMYPYGHNWFHDFKKKTRNAHPTEWARSTLRGHDLACWCPLDSKCHADVLLGVANE